MNLAQLAVVIGKRGEHQDVLAFDPGKTTGFCSMRAFEICNPLEDRQLSTPTLDKAYKTIPDAMVNFGGGEDPMVVIEDYRVFAWKTDQHAWAELHTAKLIGMIIGMCLEREWPYILQTPQQAKGFCTDKKLKEWGFYSTGNPHGNDAIRHAAYFALFGNQPTGPQNA